jgi:hypothetical protein
MKGFLKKATIVLIIAKMLVVGLIGIFFSYYLYHGSFEMFPTGEPQQKISEVSTMMIGICVILELLLAFVLGWVYRKN